MSKAFDNPFVVALTAAAVVAAVGYVLRKGVAETAAAVGGAVSGDNALTRGTPYQGAGIAGTVGAATNRASGGIFESIGAGLGEWAYGIFGEAYDPNAPAPRFVQDPATLRAGARATDRLWGPIGGVELRAQ